MVTVLAASLAFVAVICVGGAIVIERIARKNHIRDLLAQDGTSGMMGMQTGVGEPGFLEKVGGAVSSGKTSPDLRQRLVRAGCYTSKAPKVFLGAKMILLGLGICVCLALVIPLPLSLMAKVGIVIMVAGVLFFIPDILLHMRAAKRRQRMHASLPDVVDLMEICVSSGMAMDTAWNLVSDEIRDADSDLADEMALTDLEVHLGHPRVEAMRHMAERTNAQELKSLVSTLVQAERFGTSIASALQTFASDMRAMRSARAEESCEKLTVKLLLPMILFIFPAFLVVVIGPAAIRFYEMISGS